jgi:hypothetical protein
MSKIPVAKNPGSDSPAPRKQDKHAPVPAAGKRSRRKKLVTPLVLAVLGLGFLLAAILVYRSTTTEAPSPSYSRVALRTTFPVSYLKYRVIQVSSTTAWIRISVDRLSPPPTGAQATLSVAPPLGTTFRDCPRPGCTVYKGPLTGETWARPLTFESAGGLIWTATADFFVKAHSFGVTSNGVTASAAIPEVLYQGPGKVTLVASYIIPSAASYDWSSFPIAAATDFTALWQEHLVGGDTPGRVAVGINHAGQARDDDKTFLAGALVGLAGGALIAAIQEALHET